MPQVRPKCGRALLNSVARRVRPARALPRRWSARNLRKLPDCLEIFRRDRAHRFVHCVLEFAAGLGRSDRHRGDDFRRASLTQGFSAVLNNEDGTLWVMSDNGLEASKIPRTIICRVYRIRRDVETAWGGSGEVQVLEFVAE
jgi:hypothetical protein